VQNEHKYYQLVLNNLFMGDLICDINYCASSFDMEK